MVFAPNNIYGYNCVVNLLVLFIHNDNFSPLAFNQKSFFISANPGKMKILRLVNKLGNLHFNKQ